MIFEIKQNKDYVSIFYKKTLFQYITSNFHLFKVLFAVSL